MEDAVLLKEFKLLGQQHKFLCSTTALIKMLCFALCLSPGNRSQLHFTDQET